MNNPFITTPSQLICFSGVFITGSSWMGKTKVYILCANKTSFSSHLALSHEIDHKNHDYIFVEKPGDLDAEKYGSNFVILSDFPLNPNFVEILECLAGFNLSLSKKGK